jgi:hypothetical protein
MLGMRVGRGRSVALGICLALALLLLAATEAKAGQTANMTFGPLDLTVEGGEGWRRANDFDLRWSDPPGLLGTTMIAGASLRIVGPGGYDTGKVYTRGSGIAALDNVRLPGPGAFTAQVTLRDIFGRESGQPDGSATLRLDDLPPTVAFLPPSQGVLSASGAVAATVSDPHSGPAAGGVEIRRVDSDRWDALASRLEPGSPGGVAQLVATLPGRVDPGAYVLRAEATDGVGNDASTTMLAEGGGEPAEPLSDAGASRRASHAGSKTRLFARLRWRRRRGPRISVPFWAAATLSGRLLDADGAGLAGRRLRVVSRPSRGALSGRRVATVATGAHGGFKLALPSGPSRRITVSFAGDGGLAASRRPALALRVRGGVSLHAAPRALQTGESVRLWGRVDARGAPLPRRGKLVAIQYYEQDSRRWRPVLVVRSDHGGRFHSAYRFRYISGSASIRLRAVALAEERWPYAPGVSRPLTVRVSGDR